MVAADAGGGVFAGSFIEGVMGEHPSTKIQTSMKSLTMDGLDEPGCDRWGQAEDVQAINEYTTK